MTQKKGLPVFIYIAAVTLASAVIRLFQYLALFDFETGFYIVGSSAGVTASRFALIVLAISLLTFCIIGEKKEWTAFTVSSDGLGEKTSLYLGLIYLAAAAVSLWETVSAGADTLGLAVSAVQTAILAATGLLMMKNSVIPAASGFIQIALSICFFIRALHCFNSDLIIRSHSDLLIVLLTFVFGAMFFTSSARCYARLESKHSRLKEILAAGLVFLFSGLHVFSKLLMYLFGGDKASLMSAPDKNVICLLLVSGGFLCTVFLTTQRKSIEYIVAEDRKNKNDDSEEPETQEDEEKTEEE